MKYRIELHIEKDFEMIVEARSEQMAKNIAYAEYAKRISRLKLVRSNGQVVAFEVEGSHDQQ